MKDDPKVAFDNFFEIIVNVRDVAFPEVEITPKSAKNVQSPWMSGGFAFDTVNCEILLERLRLYGVKKCCK